jgi:CheY-like chemotaxis protein
LSICQKLVDLQGGKISVKSQLGKGSTFRFELTFKIPESNKNSLSASASDSFTGLEGKRILVAEDNKINFYVANKFLTGWGMIVTHVDTGQAVLDYLEKEDFDLVLMDLHMPVMDGIEATKIIRGSEIERIKTIPVVALTAAIMSESHDKIEGLIINDYVLKPFKPHELFDRIKRNIR